MLETYHIVNRRVSWEVHRVPDLDFSSILIQSEVARGRIIPN